MTVTDFEATELHSLFDDVDTLWRIVAVVDGVKVGAFVPQVIAQDEPASKAYLRSIAEDLTQAPGPGR